MNPLTRKPTILAVLVCMSTVLLNAQAQWKDPSNNPVYAQKLVNELGKAHPEVVVWALHVTGSNNPLGIEPKSEKDTVPFHPYYTMKDMFGLSVFLIIYAVIVFYIPNYLGDPDNYIKGDPMVTPARIVPEWYLLPFYAILRSVPNKLAGVLLMFGAILT